jgi:hypothetical protein
LAVPGGPGSEYLAGEPAQRELYGAFPPRARVKVTARHPVVWLSGSLLVIECWNCSVQPVGVFPVEPRCDFRCAWPDVEVSGYDISWQAELEALRSPSSYKLFCRELLLRGELACGRVSLAVGPWGSSCRSSFAFSAETFGAWNSIVEMYIVHYCWALRSRVQGSRGERVVLGREGASSHTNYLTREVGALEPRHPPQQLYVDLTSHAT